MEQIYTLYEQTSNPVIRETMPSMRTDKKNACQWVIDKLKQMEKDRLITRRRISRFKEYTTGIKHGS